MSEYYHNCEYCGRRKPKLSFREYLDNVWETRYSNRERNFVWSNPPNSHNISRKRYLVEDIIVYYREFDEDDPTYESMVKYHRYRRKIPLYIWSD